MRLWLGWLGVVQCPQTGFHTVEGDLLICLVCLRKTMNDVLDRGANKEIPLIPKSNLGVDGVIPSPFLFLLLKQGPGLVK